MSGDAELWPVDFDTLAKGDVIPQAKCCEILGKSENDPKYGLYLMRLAKRIEHEMGSRGKPCVVRCLQGGIRVLLDSEAVTYVANRFEAHETGLSVQHGRALHVDRGNLDEREQATHARNLALQAFKLLALQNARRPKLELGGNDVGRIDDGQ